MLPDSLKSLSIGLWSPVRVSGARLSCDSTRNGTRRSFDISFMPRDSELISCTRFSNRPRPDINCR